MESFRVDTWFHLFPTTAIKPNIDYMCVKKKKFCSVNLKI